MMPFIDRQRAGKELGRIRIGESVPYMKDGRELRRAVKLDTFKLTSHREWAIRKAAEVFGGEAKHDRLGWEVVTATASLPVLVPPGEILTLHWELWKNRVCIRRCLNERVIIEGDGENVQDCLCPPDYAARKELAKVGKACKPTSRLNVILPDVPGLGVWRLESHGYDAAGELEMTAELLARARDASVMLPAELWLDPREALGDDGTIHKWTVPMLDLKATMRQLIEAGHVMQELPEAPPLLAITSGGSTVEDPSTSDRDLAETYVSDSYVEHERAWAGPTIPSVDPTPAQTIANRAMGVSRPVVLRAYLEAAERDGLLEEMVTIDGADEPLGTYLSARLENAT